MGLKMSGVFLRRAAATTAVCASIGSMSTSSNAQSSWTLIEESELSAAHDELSDPSEVFQNLAVAGALDVATSFESGRDLARDPIVQASVLARLARATDAHREAEAAAESFATILRDDDDDGGGVRGDVGGEGEVEALHREVAGLKAEVVRLLEERAADRRPDTADAENPACLAGSLAIATLLVTLCCCRRQTNSSGLARTAAMVCGAALANIVACFSFTQGACLSEPGRAA